MKKITRYLNLWQKLTVNSFLIALSSRFGAALFLLGKLLRFILFVIFLLALFSRVTVLAGYSGLQVVFFFLTFNLLDTVTQLFFREVYRFRQLVVSGDFDLVLIKPMNALFRALAGGADPLDLLMLVPYVGAIIVAAVRLNMINFTNVLLYLLLFLNGFIIATGFHILVLALAVVTTEVDHTIMIYRDLTSMGRVPVDIYREPLRSFITFVIPVGIMITLPAKALLGLVTPVSVLSAFAVGAIFLFISLRIWRYALSFYTSASS